MQDNIIAMCNMCHVGGILRIQDNIIAMYMLPSNMCHVEGILRMQDNIIAMCMLPLVTCVIMEEY